MGDASVERCDEARVHLCVVIPACNEESRIRSTIRDYAKALSNTGFKWELIVELDGCSDGTAEIVRDIQQEYPWIRLIEFPERLGKGGGLIMGFREASADIIGFVDADGAVAPSEFMKIVEKVDQGYDCAIGSRRTRGAVVIDQPVERRMLGYCFNVATRMMFGWPYKDTQCGAKAFKRSALNSILPELHQNGFVFDVVLLRLLREKGFTIAEVGVRWEDRGGSKVDIVYTTADMFVSLIRLRLVLKPMMLAHVPGERARSTSLPNECPPSK